MNRTDKKEFYKKINFKKDLLKYNDFLYSKIYSSNVLVIGGAGTIGSSYIKQILKYKPSSICVVDINENNLTELVRDIRSTYGYIDGDFKTFAINFGHQVIGCRFGLCF